MAKAKKSGTSERGSKSPAAAAIERAASKLPGVTRGIACAGTALESTTFVAGKKAFAFIGSRDARLKLAGSLAEATAAARLHPDSVKVGASGWVTVVFSGAAVPDAKTLARWTAESHGLFAAS